MDKETLEKLAEIEKHFMIVYGEYCDIKEIDEELKKVIANRSDAQELFDKHSELAAAKTLESYESCNHVLITDQVHIKDVDTDFKFQACVKCGLNDKTIILPDIPSHLCLRDRLMYEFIKSKGIKKIQGTDTLLECNNIFGQIMYNQVLQENPDATEDEVIKLFIEKVNDFHQRAIKSSELHLVLSSDIHIN